MEHRESHWCWTAPRQRVQRLGRALRCSHCRRYKHKHKCGALSDAVKAWKDYPVNECTACASDRDPGEFSRGPNPTPPKVQKPREKDPGDPQTNPRPKATGKQRDSVRLRSRRFRLICVVLALRQCRSREIRQLLALFGVEKTREAINRDLGELVKQRWVTRTLVLREKSPKYQSKQEYVYSLSEAIRGKIDGFEPSEK